MKVYVDEMPSCCGNCGFCCKDDLGYWCQAREVVYIADKTLGEKRLQSCPLQSLADYTKQVRKEVCEEIKEKAELFGVCKTGTIAQEYRISKTILDQIQDKD